MQPPSELYTPDRLVSELRESTADALREAIRYLFRGPGEYQPKPTLHGVRLITVKCIRTFGHVPNSMHELRFEFERLWNSAAGRKQLRARWAEPPTIRGGAESIARDWYLNNWMREASALVANESASGEYEVLFQGPDGNWSARFVIGCVGFSNSPYIRHDSSDDLDATDLDPF